MIDSGTFLLALGSILLLALLTDALGKRTLLPRVTLLLLFGVAIGPHGLDLVPPVLVSNFELITNAAMLMVGFLLGRKLEWKKLQPDWRRALQFSIASALVPALLIGSALALAGFPPGLAILLGCIGAATDTAAIYDVVEAYGHRSRLSRLLPVIVALDDVWALLLFGIALSIVAVGSGDPVAGNALLHIFGELGGSVLLGTCLGFPVAWLTGRIRRGELLLTETLGAVFLCGGLALSLDVSPLISALVMGAVVVNFASHHKRPFQSIELIEWPFLALFFLLAGASLEFDALAAIGWLGAAFLLFRATAKTVAVLIGGVGSGIAAAERFWTGTALLPQAGVAIGMALIAGDRFPQWRDTLLPLVIGSTVLFELAGPLFTRWALARTRTDSTELDPSPPVR